MKIIKATLDRFEGNYAIIYSDSDGKQFEIPGKKIRLQAGSKLTIFVEGEKILKVQYDKEGTLMTRERIRKKYRKLTEHEKDR